MKRLSALACLLTACLGAGVPRAGGVGPRAVSIANFKFSPTDITVFVGDTIVWSNDDAFQHTTTADSGAWSSPELSRGQQFVLAPARPGRFPYHCAAHPVMRGTLVVRE